MDQPLVLARLWPLIEPGGALAILGMSAVWDAPEPWARAAVGVIRRWLGPERRAGGGLFSGTRASGHRPFPKLLADGGFARIENSRFEYDHTWTIDALLGYLYSTSLCNPALFGERRAAFAEDLRRTLLALAPDGRLVQAMWTDCARGRRP